MKINDKYEPLFDIPQNVRYFVITGGRGSSKSFSVQTAITTLAELTDRKCLLTRETMTSAHLSIIPEFQEKIELLQLDDRFVSNKTEITGASGSKIIFKGLRSSSGDQTAQLKSLQGISLWVVDEAEELTDEAKFDKIDLSIRSNKHQNIVILILNPATKEHWIYKRFFESKGVEEGFNGIVDNVCYIHTTYEDNLENLPESYINQLEQMRDSNPNKFNHVVLGGWLERAEGVVFTNWEYGKFIDTGYTYAGMDFGFSVDPDTLILVSIDKKQAKLYVKQLIYNTGNSTQELAAKIKSFNLHQTIIADSAEPRLISDLKSYGINIHPVHKFDGSIRAGIKLMQEFKIIVDSDSSDIGMELNNYSWSDKKAEVPIDAYNHAIDAIRYAVITALHYQQIAVY